LVKYLFWRILTGFLTVFFIVTVVFFAIRLIPGDPAEIWLGDYATPDLINLTRTKWGLDKPIWLQYVKYTINVISLDLADSLRMRVPVGELLLRHYPYTIRLVIFASLLSILVAIPAGVVAAVNQNSIIDVAVMTFSFLVISTPSFWLGLLMLIVFSFSLGWVPSMGGESSGNILNYFSYLILPTICLGLQQAGLISRMVRSTMIDILCKEYILVARSKGLSENVIRYKHALKNALPPIISLVGVSLVISLAGAVVLEVVFSRPGIGRLFVNAIATRDYPLIQGSILFISTGVVFINTFIDIAYGFIDPRVQ